MSTTELTPEQSHALFDILTHHEVYAEIENFKIPGAIHQYGPPFQDDANVSTSPILQTLISRFVLTLPGLKEVDQRFWRVQVADIVDELAAAELSESYDKGVLGVRKTLATAISALIEYPARGCLGGVEETTLDKKTYDLGNPDDVLQSWSDCLQACVYGDLIDEIFEKTTKTDNLEDHDTLVQGMHEFLVVNIASLLHYTLILSPEGPTLIKMIDNVHRLIPYVVVRQTLKIGNVASMINAMLRVVLAKVSIASVTNWIGWSQGADEGMNLLQQIISQVLGWDKRDLKSRAEKIEKSKNAPPKAVRQALTDRIEKQSRTEHEECRRMSKDQSMSIVAVILSLSAGPSADDLTEAQHANALEWLSLKLDIRDRQEIVRVLCQRNPDHLTVAINDAVTAYTPMIRRVHQAVNLSDTVWDAERFITDMLKICKTSTDTRKGESKPPSVEDFVDLLHRHQQSTHKFLHQVLKNDKEISSWFQDYAHKAIAQFRPRKDQPSGTPDASNLGDLRQKTEKAFTTLSDDDKEAVVAELEAYDHYLNDLHAASAARISSVIKRTRSTAYGPGAFLARWQHLLDSTVITPGKPQGPVRYGPNKTIKEESRKGAEGNDAGFLTEDQVEKIVDEKTPEMPSMERTLALFADKFKQALVGSSR